MTASTMKIPNDTAHHGVVGTRFCGSGSDAPFIFEAGRRPPVQREVRSGSGDTRKSRERNEERVLQVVHATLAWRICGEIPDELVVVLQELDDDVLRQARERRLLEQDPVGTPLGPA